MSLSVGGRPILRIERRHCPHCVRSVSLKTFKMHKRLYYDGECDKWLVSGGSHNEPHELSLESEPGSDSDSVQFLSSPEQVQHERELLFL